MRRTARTPLASALVLAFSCTGSSRAGDELTLVEAREIARDAYIFCYPLALQYRTMYIQAIDPKAKEYVGGFGKYRHYGMSTPENKDIVTPNNDTPYSWAHVDLRAEPWVLTLPKTDGRYFTTQWCDLWHFVLDNPGAVLDGNDGGNYLLAPPDWEGELPKGIKRIVRGESQFMGTLTRTGVSGPDDFPNMRKTQEGYGLQPLSSYLGKPAPEAAPEIKWPAWVDGIEKTIDIFGYVNFLLPYTRPNPLDKPILDRMARIGIAPGGEWEPAKMDPALKGAIEAGISDAQRLIDETIPTIHDASKCFGGRGKLKTDYLNRTLGVVIGQWGNVTEQAVYQTWPKDSDGMPLDAGKNNYTITFKAGELPKARFFWSITMYNLPERLLVDNRIKRYSIGSQTPMLKEAQDGSVTIYIQKDSPGEGLEGNWLPAPAAPFFAVLRIYGPGDSEQSGEWRAPEVRRVKADGGVPGPVPGTIMTPAYARAVAQAAYVWGWPLVNMHNRREAMRKVERPGLNGGVMAVAPLNQLCMFTDYVKPIQRYVACPNQDVVYGFGCLSLDLSPVVIQVPDFKDRFWVYQIVDQRTDAIAKLGKMYGTKPGFYLIANRGWEGDVPEGISGVFRSPTDIAIVVPRAFLNDTAEDREAVQSVINQVMAYPLKDFDGRMKTTDWKSVPSFPDPQAERTGGSEVKWVVPEKFFATLPAVLDEVPPLPGEEALYRQFRSLLATAQADPKLMTVLNETALVAERELMGPLHEFRNNGVPLPNGWTTVTNGAEFGTDYLTRAAVAKSNILVNRPSETRYFYLDVDGDSQRLTGSNAYTLTFGKGELPPVRGFWSLTLYDDKHFFSENELGRYSLGTKNRTLRFQEDGSLVLYVQRERPSDEKVSNWLPAPEGEFSLYLRAYWPNDAISGGKWSPPPVVNE